MTQDTRPRPAWRTAAPATTLATLAMLLIQAGPASAQAQHAHVHGVARLDVAVEADGASLALTMPLDSVTGFEHAPRTEAQRQAAARALARLRDPAPLFVTPAAAGCRVVEAQVHAPVLEGGAAAHGHADLEARYRLRCQQPAALRELRVDLFEAFARVERLEVQLAGPQSQSRARLSPRARALRW